ncbi:MAG: alpha-hydroxy acid oxidase [Candidatus Promineifilaceae bacterium]
MPKFYSIDEARRLAQKRMPRLMFDFVDGAAGSEIAKRLNREALDEIRLQPRVLINVDQRSLEKEIFGRKYSLPFGIAPMGMCNLAWPGADKLLADAAVKYNIPHTLSTMSSSSIEDVGNWAGQNAWFQLYVSQSDDLAMELIDRANAANYPVLMLTVDVPQVAPRRRDLRNGFGMPFRIGPKQFIDFATHPQWSLTTLYRGAPQLANIITSKAGQNFSRNASRGRVDWDFLNRVRDRWPRKLVVKGIMSSADAKRISESGADAIYVSNHGGRQLDSSPPAIQMLPLIREAVGEDFPLIFDSGIRNGEGVIKALALGADFVMLGRPFLYGVGAAGQQGLENVIDVLSNEISVTMAQLGCTEVEAIDHQMLVAQK